MIWFHIVLVISVLILGMIVAICSILQMIDDIKERRWRNVTTSGWFIWMGTAAVIVAVLLAIKTFLEAM